MLLNISRGKCNQTMKFRKLTEYNMRNIFLGKSYAKFDGVTIPKVFSKKIKMKFISGSIV